MIGKNIKSLRKTHGLTQPEFARIIGISRGKKKSNRYGRATDTSRPQSSNSPFSRLYEAAMRSSTTRP